MLYWPGKFVSSYRCSTSTIQSPGYPSQYPENLDCTWSKSIPSYYRTRVFRFHISNLDLEQCARCSCDYVEVFDGSSKHSKSLGKFCAGEVRLLTAGNHLTVVFCTDHSQGKTYNNGFQATYSYISQSAVCVNSQGKLRTAYSNYGNVDCSWTLSSYSGYFVVLEVSSLRFGTCSSTCSCGQLEVFDTSTLTKTKIGSWCSPPRKPIVSNGRQMLVRFVAFPASTTQHFQAQYKYEKETKVCKQSSTLEATSYSRTLRSYDRPSKYIKQVDCTWKITANDGNLIRFTVTQLDLGGCTSCGFLQIFDGQSEWTRNSLGKWRSSAPDIISSGKYLLVKFKTTKFDTNNGLIATYQTIAKQRVCPAATGNQGIIESYNYPYSHPGNINCLWKLKAPPNYRIMFMSLYRFKPLYSCESKCNLLAVYDGPSISANKLAKYKDGADFNLVSSSNQLSILYKTYRKGSNHDGFRGKYVFIHKSEVCKDNLNLHASKFGQTISSRNFPEKYWGNMRCFWHINADHDHKIRLVVQTIDFEDCSNCGCDFIQIFDGPNRYSKSLKKWCRNLPDLVSSGSDLYIEMRTDANNYYRGFKAKYFAVHKNDVCPGSGVLTGQFGTIKSPNFPEQYFGGIACEWLITAPDSKRIRIRSTSLNLESCNSCSSCDRIEISDNFPENPNIGTWCKASIDVISRNNIVNIKFTSNVNDVGGSFQIEYYTVDENKVCPLRPTSHSSGTLTSLGYPKENYPGNLNCKYHIKAADENQVVRLEFTHFQLAACKRYVSSCLKCGDTVQATDVGDDMKLAHFHPWCSIDPQPTHIFSSRQNLFLNFHTDQFSQDVGFKATYRSVDKNLGCLNTGTLTKRSGNFSGPRSPFNLETLCTWLIKGPSKHKIELTFRYSSMYSGSISDGCRLSYVEVYDGDSPSKKSFGRFCKHYWRKKIKSTGSSLYVTLWVDSTFQSDDGIPSFFATYRAVNHASKAVQFENILIGCFIFSAFFAHIL